MNGKKALITGASSGIGQATAIRLAKEGYDLILLARRSDRLERLRTKIEAEHRVKVAVLSADIRDLVTLKTCFEKAESELSGVSVLVNNAGLARGTEKMQAAKIDDWNEMLDTNVKGLLFVTRRMLPIFLKNKNGHVINVGSVAGRWVYPGGAVYCATKFAVRAISEGLRMDLLGTPVRVTNVEPGMVETEFSLVRLQDPVKANAVYEKMSPLLAEDIADCISWVVSRPARVNVQEIVIFPTDQAAVGQVHRHE